MDVFAGAGAMLLISIALGLAGAAIGLLVLYLVVRAAVRDGVVQARRRHD